MHATTRRTFLAGTAGIAALPLATAAAARALPTGDPLGAFLRAAREGDVLTGRALLDAHPALVDAADDAGRTAFALAHLAGHDAFGAFLVERGFEPDFAESALAGDLDRAVELAKQNPKLVNAAHPIGGSALYGACLRGRDALYKLQDVGSDVNANPLGARGITPVRAALECEELNLVHATLVAVLGNLGEANAPQRNGDSVLHAAAARGDASIVRLVLRYGGDVAARNTQGETALDVATRLGHAAAVAQLSEHASVARNHMDARMAFDASGARVERPDMSDVPQAIQSQVTGQSHFNLARVTELLDADPRRIWSLSTQGELAVEACGHTGNRPIMRLHLDLGAAQSTVTSVSVGDLARAKEMLTEDPRRVHERGPHDFALMWYAAIGGDDPAAAELLLSFGAPVDQESMGTTCLHWAASRGRLELAAYLLERGADIDALGLKFDAAGITPLGMAKLRKQEALIKFLEQRGAHG